MKTESTIALCLVAILSLLGSKSFCQEQEPPTQDGRWTIHPEHLDLSDWLAQWIWMEESQGVDMLLVRKVFRLDQLPDSAELRITASSIYNLHINGVHVLYGPARSAPHHQSFDMLDVKDYLREGENCIAVRVHHQAKKHSHHFKGRAGLLAQLDLILGEDTVTVATDDQWKVMADRSWDSNSPVISRFQMVVNDRVDLRDAIPAWKEVHYDDTDWDDATPLMRKVGWPSPPKNAIPQALTPPWTQLVARDVPYVLEQVVPGADLIEAAILTREEMNKPYPLKGAIGDAITHNPSAFGRKEKPLAIPTCDSSSGYFLLFDFGQIRNGHPMLDIEGPAGTVVDVFAAPYVVNGRFSYQILDSDFHDRVVLSGSRDSWEATYFKPARYLGLFVHGHAEHVRLHGLSIRALTYPFERRGYMESTDAAWVRAYMEAAAKTIDVCTTDGYTDNYRERRQYAQTGYYGALGNYWLFGDHHLQRRYLLQVAQEQEANGIMPAYAPLASDDYMIILDSNCLWIRSLRNYLLYSGDYDSVRQLMPTARKLLKLLHGYTDKLGLLRNPPYPYWLDHSLMDRQGANFCLNGHYLGALEDFAEILDWLEEGEGDLFRKRAHRLRQALQQHLWNDEKGLFTDALIINEQSTRYTEHANAMALAEQIATPEQARSIIEKVLDEDELNYLHRASGMTMVTPAMSHFLHKGLCEYDQIDASFDLFRKRFDKMLQDEYNGTLWEEWWLDGTGRSGRRVEKTRSDAQTESAFPPALFGEYLLGVLPLEPGWKTAFVQPRNHRLGHLKADVPTPLGILSVEWAREKDGTGVLELNIPEGMQMMMSRAAFEVLSTRALQWNDQDAETKEDGSIRLMSGRHVIEF
ncbi:MAG: glycoside hydrolase family 78 protein [Saprospiraceae bacterium]|nr:glycoside hydrolase family 78 protein [Saprospiraceae bacterium]